MTFIKLSLFTAAVLALGAFSNPVNLDTRQAGCAATTCLVGYDCIEVDGVGTCVLPPPTTCAATSCPVGSACIERNGQAFCIRPQPITCAVVLCPAGTVCLDIGGQPRCTRLIPETCGTKVCSGSQFCCNRSCSICAPKGGACTQQVCAAVE